jgi:hypothetical protein
MTRPRRERSYKRLSKGKIGERASAAADHKNLTVTVSIAGIADEVENDRRESVMKLAQAHDVSAKMVHAILHNDLQLSRSRPDGWSNRFTRRRKGVIQNMTGNHSNDRCGFLTILDNVLTVCLSARGKKRADRPQPQSGVELGRKCIIRFSRKQKFNENVKNFRENYEIFALKFLRKFRLFHFRKNYKPIFTKILLILRRNTRQSSGFKGTVSQDLCARF